MSFLDSSNPERDDTCSALDHHSRWKADSKKHLNHAKSPKPLPLTSPPVSLLDPHACTTEAHQLNPITHSPARQAACNNDDKNDSGTPPPVSVQRENESSESDAFSDAASVESKTHKQGGGSSCYGSVRSSAGSRSHLRHHHRVIYPSAPITFTKGLSGAQPWEAYAKTPPGYLDEETVRAAAAADENIARKRQQLKSAKNEGLADVLFMEGNGEKAQNPEAAETLPHIQQEEEEGGDSVSAQNMNFTSSVSNPPTEAADANVTSNVTTSILGNEHVHRGSSVSTPLTTGVSFSRERRINKNRPLLGSWILGGGGTGTEIERLLKEENEIAEALAARNELTERKLLQEDMEAMIDNLQQVKGFLVKKLRECETALLTTAQERDGLEATLQHVQSGIQDTIAEHRRLVDEYKTQLTAKTQENEDLSSRLKITLEENEQLKKENKTLSNELKVARAEAADVVAARGFHIEEYQRAVQTLMERNKAQHREVKRLRVQLIKTREDYANVLARVDELESLADFHKNTLQDVIQRPPSPQQTKSSSWRISKVLQRRARPPNNSQQSSDASSPISSHQKSEENENHIPPFMSSDHGSSSSRVSPGVVSEGEGGAAKLDVREALSRSRNSKREGDSVPTSTAPAASPAASSLGRSVTGLLASSVSRVLQTFEHAVATDRELQEALEQEESDDCPDTSQPMALHEEAALFLKRTSESSDIVVQLEEGSDPHQHDDVMERDESEAAGDRETSTLGNVARTVWQAANDMLSERTLPPARLSTLRTIAASTPSAWEVILERHRAAKSMPLFSSLPPAAFPLLAEGKGEKGEVLSSKSSSAGKSAVSSNDSNRRRNNNHRRPPSTGHHHVIGEHSHDSQQQQRGVINVELCSEPRPRLTQGASDSGEVVVWQVDAPISPSSSAPAAGFSEGNERKHPTRLDRSCLESPTCEGFDDVKEDFENTQNTICGEKDVMTETVSLEPRQTGTSPDSSPDDSKELSL